MENSDFESQVVSALLEFTHQISVLDKGQDIVGVKQKERVKNLYRILQHLNERYHTYCLADNQGISIEVSWEMFKQQHTLDINGVHRFLLEAIKDKELASFELINNIALYCTTYLFDKFMAQDIYRVLPHLNLAAPS